MQIFTNKEVSIVCNSEGTRSGFRHLATLCLNGIERDTAKCCYQNRTWESFCYQTVMSKLLEKTTVLTGEQKASFKKAIIKTDRGY